MKNCEGSIYSKGIQHIIQQGENQYIRDKKVGVNYFSHVLKGIG